MTPHFFLGSGIYFILIALSYFFFDKPIAEFLHSFSSPLLSKIAECVTFFGDGLLYLILLPALLIFFYFIRKNKIAAYRILYLASAALASGIICDLLKPLLGRVRPSLWFDQHIYGFHLLSFNTHHALYASFPSGHTTTIASIMTAIYFIFPKYRYYCLALIVLVAASRLVLGAHYLSDVMAGTYLGALISYWIFKKNVRWIREPLGERNPPHKK